MNRYILQFSLLLSVSIAFGQTKLDLQKADGEGFETKLQVQEGQTLYGIARAMNLSIDELIDRNNKTSVYLRVGEQLLIGIDSERIFHDQPKTPNYSSLIYSVEAGDNLFRIARRANLSVDDLLRLNNKKTTAISLKEKLLLGWLQWSPQSPSVQLHQTIEMAKLTNNFKILPLNVLALSPSIPALASDFSETRNMTTVKEKGIAYWDKKEKINKELVVMHPHARINSQISLYNPMLKRKVNALVVGEFPQQSYANDISVVISPSVANALGALDKRFLVEITYTE